MAWRTEKTSTGMDIVIDGWDDGIAAAPDKGHQNMQNVNIISMPGVLAVGYGMTTSTLSGGTLGVPISRATRYTTYTTQTGTGSALGYMILDATGQVWEATAFNGTWTRLSNGEITTNHTSVDAIFFWKGYLLKTRGANIDYWNGTIWNSGGSPMSTALTAGVNHYAITPINDAAYILNGNKVARITEVTTFDPTAGGTFSLTTTWATLPVYECAQSMAAISAGTSGSTITILIGGSQNVVYPFLSTQSVLTPGFQTPIYVADGYIKRMVSANQNAYIFTGNVNGRGRIYITNSTQAQEFYKVPDSITGNQDPYFEWGDAIFHRGSLLFGFFANKNSGSGAVIGVSDVWALDITTKAFRSISSLSASAGYANATALIADQSNSAASGYAYMAGWTDNASTNTIGYSGTTSGIGSAVVSTDQIPVGTFFNKYTYQQFEIKFQTPLQSGESVIVVPISDGTSGTTTTINTTGAISGTGDATVQNSQWLQFQLSMTGNSATSGCRIKEIRVHGIPIK